MSESQATTSNLDQSSASLGAAAAAAASYADDFHSESSHDEPGSDLSLHPQAAVAYSYRDNRRSIRIYAPTIADAGEDQQPRARTTGQRRSTVSYSSNFEAAAASSRSESPPNSSASNDSTGSDDSGSGRIRVVSIDELSAASDSEVRAEDRFLEDASRDTDAVDATARALLSQLRGGRRLEGGGSSQPSAHPSLLLLGVTPSTTVVPRLTVELLRVESLRLAGRLLIGCRTHEPSACPDCRAASERLARSDWLRALANRARRDTVARRLEMHAPAGVMSRQMLNVAQNARLVSDWMRTGRVPEMRGIT